MVTAAGAVQARIDAQQNYDALVYGLRNLGGVNYEAVRAREVAEELLGHYVASDLSGWELRRAKKVAAEQLAEAKAAVKAIGTARQLRLALATEDAGLDLAVAA